MADRTPAEYAIEHGEYLAVGAEHLIDSINALYYAIEMEYSEAEIAKAQEVADEARSALRIDVYEFRKRRLRALATPAPAQPEETDLLPDLQPVSAWWHPKAEQFMLPPSYGTRPFARVWEPLYDMAAISKIESAAFLRGRTAGLNFAKLSAGADASAQPDPRHVANERGEGEDAKDAARYRWLRDRLPWTLMSAHGYTRMAARLPASIKADMDEAHEMDAALDAAMASGLSAIDQALAAAPKEKP